MNRGTAFLLVIAMGVSGCNQGESSVDRHAVGEEVGARYGGYDDTIAVAESSGADYLAVVTRCLLRDREAMHTLFRLTKFAGFDCASSEGNAGVLHDVLRDVGERFFAACLDAEPTDVQDEVRSMLLYDMGWGNVEGLELSELQRLYPKVFPKGYDPNHDR